MLSLQFGFLERRESGLSLNMQKEDENSASPFSFTESNHREVRGSRELLPVQSSFTPLPYRLEYLYRITRIMWILEFLNFYSIPEFANIDNMYVTCEIIEDYFISK